VGRRGKQPKAGKRERNGRLSRAPEEAARRNLADLDREQRDTLEVGLSARERIFGVDPKQSRDQMAGSVIGRWCLQGIVTRAQYDAAVMFAESIHRNRLAIDAPKQPGAVNLNATRGRPVGLENAQQVTQWMRAHRAAMLAIQAKQNETRLVGNLYGSLYLVLVNDVDLEHLKGDTRTALNALVRHYGLLAVAA
jgi:hypothetical protein